MVIQVPNEHAGRIIGKGGAMIKSIQQESGASVQLAPPNGPLRTITLTGARPQIESSYALIQQIVSQASMRQ